MSKTPIQLSDHFTCRKLICFTLPSITMIIFTAIYGVVDGFTASLCPTTPERPPLRR